MRRSAKFEPIGSTSRSRMMREAISALVLFAFVFRVILAAVPMPSATTASGATLIPICTADGLKWLKFDPNTPKTPSKASGDCPLCLAAHGFAIMLPVVVLPAIVKTAIEVPPAFHQDAPTLCIAARPPPSRAPPLSFS